MYENILVPMKLADSDKAVVEHASSLALLTTGKVTFLHVIHSHSRDEAAYRTEEAQESLDRTASETVAKGIQADTRIVTDEPAAGIIAVAREIEADLIVMATHGHSEVRHLFVGSVTEDVIRGSEAPVLLIRPVETD